MTVQNEVDKRLRITSDRLEKEVLKLIKAEFQREPTKEVTDSRALSIIKAIVKESKDFLKYATDGAHTLKINNTISILESFLPAQVSREVIQEWIAANIDMKQYKTPLMAMRDIMNHFGSTADGAVVREIINGYVQ